MCDKKNSVLFTDTECVVLSSDFKLTDENHVLLKVPRKNNMYNVDLRNLVPQQGKFDGKADGGFFVGYSVNKSIDAGQAKKKTVPSHEYILLPLWTPDSPISSSLKSSDDKVADDVEKKTIEDLAKEDDKDD
ncbi:hypothetical protein Tco_1109232 [Tanacetum coccineum]